MIRIRKILLIGLILTGIGVWSYNGLVLLDRLGQTSPPAVAWNTASGRPIRDHMARQDAARTPYTGAFRDPFDPDVRLTPPPSSNPKPASMRAAATVSPPQLVLEGIMWDQIAPIATIKGPDGRTENLRVGMTVAGATVTRIERAAVVLRFGTQTVRLVPPGLRL